MKQEFTVTTAGSSPGPVPSAQPAHEMPADPRPPDGFAHCAAAIRLEAAARSRFL